MPFDVRAAVDPAHTALLTVEVQEGVVGDASAVPELAAAAEPALPRIAALAAAARGVGVPVVHCTVDARADGMGANRNTRLFAALAKHALARGAPGGGQVRRGVPHPAIGPHGDDVVLGRLHGVSPMTGTSLDPVLRNLGVRTVVVTGVSVNVAVTGLVFEAVNHGYQVVLPRDAVAGVDAAYVEAVVERTLSMLATITTTDDLLAAWRDT